MPRSRNIKPGFFANDELAQCEYGARLLFVGLWTIADRAGRLEDRPTRIKGQLFPYDSPDVDKWISQLSDYGFITRYTVDGCKYIQINNFSKHQTPHVKEPESTIPAPDKNHTSTKQAPEVSYQESGINNQESAIKNQGRIKRPAPPEFTIPIDLNNSDFLYHWERWLKYRKEIKKPLTQSSAQAQLDTFAVWGPERAIAAISHTILMQWQGLREPDAKTLPASAQKRFAITPLPEDDGWDERHGFK